MVEIFSAMIRMPAEKKRMKNWLPSVFYKLGAYARK